MNNDTTNIMKLTYLDRYPIDYSRTNVIISRDGLTITIHLYLDESSRQCPTCKSHNTYKHDTVIKTILHPVMVDKNVVIKLHQRKYKCNFCGHYFYQFNPLVCGAKNISREGILYILKRLLKPDLTFTRVATDLAVPKTSVIRAFDDFVVINKRDFPTIFCIDENYQKTVTDKKFCCIIYDPMKKKIIDILNSRLKNHLIDYFSRIPISVRLKVKIVNMDMYSTYRDVCLHAFPNISVVADSLCKY